MLLDGADRHRLTQEIPRTVHIMLPRGVNPARLDHPTVEVCHCSREALTSGVEVRGVDGVPLRVTMPAKFVAAAFRFRGRLCMETTRDAVKQALRAHAAVAARRSAK